MHNLACPHAVRCAVGTIDTNLWYPLDTATPVDEEDGGLGGNELRNLGIGWPSPLVRPRHNKRK